MGYEWTRNASFASVYHNNNNKKKTGRTSSPPPLAKGKKISCITYIGDRSFEVKNYIQFLGEK